MLIPFSQAQNRNFSISVGYNKYIYNYQSIFDFRSDRDMPDPCLSNIQRSQFTRWISPEIEILYYVNIQNVLGVSSGLRYIVKGKDITAQTDLSCPDKYPILQIKSGYIYFPFYIQTNPQSWIGLKAGFLYGVKIWDHELVNDSKYINIEDARFKSLFGTSKEISADLRFNLNRQINFYLGGIIGLDKLDDQFTHWNASYHGIRAMMQVNLIKNKAGD